MFWWQDFSESEVDTEFAEIASWGLSLVRIFLLWEDFQPLPDRISPGVLSALGAVLDSAQQHGLGVLPTFFCGHMSGVNYWPVWALSAREEDDGDLRWARGQLTTRTPRDPYLDPLVLAAQADLVRAVCGRYAQHPAVWGWDLANEPDNFSRPKSYVAGAAWHRTMATLVRSLAPQPVTCGLHLAAVAGPYTGFRPDLLAADEDVQSMHPYSMYYRLTKEPDPLCSDVAPLACLVTEALGGKPVLCAEFGCATAPERHTSYLKWTGAGALAGLQYFADEAGAAQHYQEVLDKLARCGAVGALCWMFSDYDPVLYGTPPFDSFEHERYFGLTRADGALKPHGTVLAAFAQRARAGEAPPRTHPPLAVEPVAWYGDESGHFDHLFRTWQGRL